MSSAPGPASWSWPAEVGSVRPAREVVVDWLQRQSSADPPMGDVALLISEAMTNAVIHAYVGHEVPGEVHVHVALDRDEVMVVIEDQGNGLRPRPDSPGLGYGLALMVAISNRFEAQSAESQGTRLRAWFSRNPAARTLPN
jgi:anti-sigma regulatory factor (Ser/Thr protein kinase)